LRDNFFFSLTCRGRLSGAITLRRKHTDARGTSCRFPKRRGKFSFFFFWFYFALLYPRSSPRPYPLPLRIVRTLKFCHLNFSSRSSVFCCVSVVIDFCVLLFARVSCSEYALKRKGVVCLGVRYPPFVRFLHESRMPSVRLVFFFFSLVASLLTPLDSLVTFFSAAEGSGCWILVFCSFDLVFFFFRRLFRAKLSVPTFPCVESRAASRTCLLNVCRELYLVS